MIKKNWLVGSIALGVGMVVGIMGYALATTPVEGDSRLVNFLGNKEAQATSGTVSDPSNNPPLNLEGQTNVPNPLESLEPSIDGLSGNLSNPNEASTVPAELAEEITADYKQDLGFFFEAWKSPEMVTFRTQLAKAYKGDLYEKHARQAENFIVQGVGLEVKDIRFERLTVESASNNAATLRATYTYTAQDYNIGEQIATGEKKEHTVNVRVNLIKDNGRWLITGETITP